MYKTVRHGENSLQYTILPQTEEVLSNSGMKGKGRDYSPSIHVRRSKKRCTITYIILLIIVGVVALALVSTSLYVTSAEIYNRVYATTGERDSSVITFGGIVLGRENIMKSRKKELKMFEMTTAQPEISSTTRLSTTQQTSSTTAYEKRTKPAWSMPAFKLFWTSTTTAIPTTLPPLPIVEDKDELRLPNGPFSRFRYGNNVLRVDNMSRKPWSDKDIIIQPTVAPELSTVQNIYNYVTKVKDVVSAHPTIAPTRLTNFEDVLITTKTSNAFTQTTEDHFEYSGKTYPLGKDLKDMKDTILDDDDEFKDAEVDEVFSLPPLRREPGPAGPPKDTAGWVNVNEEDVKMSTPSSSRIGNVWPFDPSSLFQWPDYSQDDSIVVPLLVGVTTLITVLVILLVVVTRIRRDQAKGAQHIGKLTADLQEEDNTNLLTAENPEDE